jgi:hypothetical protein
MKITKKQLLEILVEEMNSLLTEDMDAFNTDEEISLTPEKDEGTTNISKKNAGSALKDLGMDMINNPKTSEDPTDQENASVLNILKKALEIAAKEGNNKAPLEKIMNLAKTEAEK